MYNTTKCFFLFLIVLSITSCASKKNTVNFQSNIHEVKSLPSYTKEVIKSDDILSINVTALDMTSILPFLEEKNISNNMDQSLIDGYKVADDGSINLPLIGKVIISNLTVTQAADKITEELSKSIIKPIVNVRLLNFTVSVLGEVKRPGTFKIYDPKINIIQALGLAGDVTIYGKKNNIKLIRETNGKFITTKIDITKTDFINSDFYYLKNNDAIYVEPSFAKIKNSGYIGQISNVATVFSLIMSIIILNQNN